MAVIATRIRSFAPQLLVDDLERAIEFYTDVLGFSFGPTWRGFYAIGERDGVEVHLKCAPKNGRGARKSATTPAFGRLCQRHWSGRTVCRLRSERRDNFEAPRSHAMGNERFLS
jgi:catechol-2,3-dioxygenase